MTITIVIIKPQTGNGSGVWMASYPEEMVLTLESWIWAVEDVVGFSGSLATEILNIVRCAAC